MDGINYDYSSNATRQVGGALPPQTKKIEHLLGYTYFWNLREGYPNRTGVGRKSFLKMHKGAIKEIKWGRKKVIFLGPLVGKSPQRVS